MNETIVDQSSDVDREQADAEQTAQTRLLHELRTPLYSILAATDLLEESLSHTSHATTAADRPSELVALVRESTDHLISLINNSLDARHSQATTRARAPAEAQRHDTSAPDPNTRRFPLHRNLKQVSAILAPQLQRKSLVFECQVAGDVPATLPGNATAFRQILINLLGNAVKFTMHGGVRLDISCETHTGKPWLTLRVTDSGPGMDQAALTKILPARAEPSNAEKLDCVAESLPFAQDNIPGAHAETREDSAAAPPVRSDAQRCQSAHASQSGLRQQPGSGLGLSIVQALLEDTGGYLECHSSPGHGTSFTVRLPVADSIPASIENAAHRDAANDLKLVGTGPREKRGSPSTRRHILVAEDNVTNRRITALLLTGAGHEVTCVASAEAARQALRNQHYDIAIVDLHLPHASGIELAESAPKTLPIILLTGDADPALTERAIQAGCVALLHKPLRAETLRNVVETHAPCQAVQVSNGAAANAAVLEELSACGADTTELKSLITGFIFESRMDAMRMQQAATREDWQKVRSLLHARAGAAQVIGAEALRQLLADLALVAAAGDSEVFWTRMAPLAATIARTESALMQLLCGVDLGFEDRHDRDDDHGKQP